MQLGLTMDEKGYRQIPLPSYSALSNIAKENRSMVSLDRTGDISDLDGIIIGTLTDSIICGDDTLAKSFIINNKPSGKPLEILKKLSEREDLKDPKNILSPSNTPMLLEELDSVEYYKSSSFENRMKHLKKYNAYAKALASTKNEGLIISRYQAATAIRSASRLTWRFPFLKDENTLFQVKLIGEVNGHKVKCMLDAIYIDHSTKTIVPYDIKTGINPYNLFFVSGFLGFNYYLQSSLYHLLLTLYIKEHPELSDYTIGNFRFLYCSRKDFLPIQYKVTESLLDMGLEGFTYQGTKFQGVYELLEEYAYKEEHPNNPFIKGFDGDEIDLARFFQDGPRNNP